MRGVLSIGFVIAGLGASSAGANVSLWAIAQEVCSSATEALVKASPNWAHKLGSHEANVVPEMDEDLQVVFGKHGAWSHAAIYQAELMVAYMTDFDSPARPSEVQREELVLLTDLVGCLMIDAEEREALDAWAADNAGPTWSGMFHGLDRHDCTKWQEASERLLALELNIENFAPKRNEILASTVGSCEENQQ